MSHNETIELLGAYLDGELNDKLRQDVDAHLRTCPDCRQELHLLQQLDTVTKGISKPQKDKEYWDSFAGRVKSGIHRQMAGAQHKEVYNMFQDSFIRPEKNMGLRAVVFPISLIAHAMIVALLVIIPLLSTSELPRVEVYSAFLAPDFFGHDLSRLHALPNQSRRSGTLAAYSETNETNVCTTLSWV